MNEMSGAEASGPRLHGGAYGEYVDDPAQPHAPLDPRMSLLQCEYATAAEKHQVFTGIVQEYNEQLVRSMERTFPGRGEEIVQTAFMKLWEHPGGFRHGGNLLGYLRTVARRCGLDMIRADLRRVHGRCDSWPDTDHLAMPSVIDTADMVAGKLAVETAVQAISRRLGSSSHTSVLDLYVRGFSQRETAETLGIPAGTVKSRVHRGVKMAAQLPEVQALKIA